MEMHQKHRNENNGHSLIYFFFQIEDESMLTFEYQTSNEAVFNIHNVTNEPDVEDESEFEYDSEAFVFSDEDSDNCIDDEL